MADTEHKNPEHHKPGEKGKDKKGKKGGVWGKYKWYIIAGGAFFIAAFYFVSHKSSSASGASNTPAQSATPASTSPDTSGTPSVDTSGGSGSAIAGPAGPAGTTGATGAAGIAGAAGTAGATGATGAKGAKGRRGRRGKPAPKPKHHHVPARHTTATKTSGHAHGMHINPGGPAKMSPGRKAPAHPVARHGHAH